jgi:hypothetical protein
MNGIAVQSAQFRIDAPTVLATLLTVTFFLGGGWACTFIPIVAGYNPGEMLQKLLPIASAGLFPIFRQALAFRQTGIQATSDDSPGYLFVKYTVVGSLLLFGLFEVAAFLIGAMAASVHETIRATSAKDIGDEIKVAVMQFAGLFVTAPVLVITAAMLGWRINRRSRLRHSVMCAISIVIIVAILRVIDIAWASTFNDTALQTVLEQSGKWALIAPSLIVLIGMLLGIGSSAVGLGVMRLFGRNPKIA